MLRVFRGVWFVVAISLLASAPAFSSPQIDGELDVVPVSPGSRERVAGTSTACPTFSWSSAGRVSEVELLVVSLEEGFVSMPFGEESAQIVIRQRVPGGASSWTPSGKQCLPPGEFAWLTRPVTEGVELTGWSAPSLFSVGASSPAEDLGKLLEQLERFVESARSDPEIAAFLARLLQPEVAGTPFLAGAAPPASESGGGLTGIVAEPPAITLEPVKSSIAAELPSTTGTFQAAIDGRIVGSPSGSAQFGVFGYTSTAIGAGVYGNALFSAGVTGRSTQGDGISGYSEAATGSSSGVRGEGNSPDGYGGFFFNGDGGIAVLARGYGQTRSNAALRVENLTGNQGMATYMTNGSNYATAHFANSGTGEVLYLQNGGTNASGASGGDFIKALNNPENDAQFRVLTSGEVRSDVGFTTPAADFAEMLPAADGLEPGDLLVIGKGGRLEKSQQPMATRVAGVYSTQPGFTGGHPVDGPTPGHIPLAVVGIVPVKATADGGPIREGDLLVSSRTPGHVMRARRVKRDGVVVGKALEALPHGRGKIRMLVVLQ